MTRRSWTGRLAAVAALLCMAASGACAVSAGSAASLSAASLDAKRAAGRWKPAVGTAWQWQLTTPVDVSVNVPVYDIDWSGNSAAVVRRLHQLGRHVICYVNVGAAENFRSDYHRFPAKVLGKPNGWPGELWLDIRQRSVLQPIIAKRFDTCKTKGFDAIEPDLVDGYGADTGFKLTPNDQLRYNRMIAKLAHDRGLSVALKNDVEQVGALVKDFDFSIDEQCAQFNGCHLLVPFIKAHKAVLQVEYHLRTAQFCGQSKRLGFSAMLKHESLDAWRRAC